MAPRSWSGVQDMRAVSSSSIAAAPHVPARLFCCEIRARRVTYSYSVHPSTSIIGMSALGAGLPSFVGEERLGLRPEKVCTIFRGVPVHICSTAGKRPADKRFSVRMSASAKLPQVLVKKQKFSTFTNKEGRVLTQHSENVWGAERPFAWLGIDVNGRGAVVKLSDGSLWVHSPVNLDPELKAAMDALGPVKHIVTPNFEHNKFAPQWIDAYPDAKAYVCPGGLKKYPDVKYSQEVGEGNQAPPEWLGEIEPTFLSYEAVPLLNFPFFNEVVFVHKPSGTLIATDLVWNYPGSGTPRGTQAWKFGMDRVYLPFYKSFMIKDKGAYRGATQRLTSELQWDSILPCHGDYIPSGGKQILQKHLGLQH